MPHIDIGINNKNVPIYSEYFHALSLTESTDIFNTATTSFDLKPNPNYLSYDVIDELINPFISDTKPILRTDGTKRLVPMEGALFLPDQTTFTGKVPLVLIGHGNHTGYATIDYEKNKNNPPETRSIEIAVLPEGDRIQSYLGYLGLQKALAEQGIASYSINLNIVNALENNETDAFKKQGLDFNQRILLFFLHLKLLKVLAGEPVAEPTGANAFPFRFLKGTSFVDLKDELPVSPPGSVLHLLRSVLADRIDYTKLGFMGHSRGADAVSRIPAYFFNGTTATEPVFPKHTTVNERIKNLCVQIGSPKQEHIKCILALQPTATRNAAAPADHGYIIDNPQTLYVVGLGTHDEDVSLDPVRIYEYPSCPKLMMVINGASHKGFNSQWAREPDKDPLTSKDVKVRLLSDESQEEILRIVFEMCFTAVMTNDSFLLKYFTKELEFALNLNKAIDIQSAWKFGFPFGSPNVMNSLDAKVTGITKSSIKSTDFKFEQDINAFTEERKNEGIFTLQIPLNILSDSENLSKHTHFSFRFARGYELDEDEDNDRIEVKNFTIEFFENNTLVGKTIEGKDITNLTLKAIRAFDERERSSEDRKFIRSILMQTVEIPLAGRSGLDKVDRIEIKVVPDPTKDPPRPASKVIGGSVVMGIVGGGVGVGGGLIYNHCKGEDKKWIVVAGGVVGAALGAGITYKVLKADENAYAFTDFLLTNRHI